ncbi:cadherin-related family member 2 [Protopterus annectens]|uniref:cadherin-related family member 2 n=1 Tax=Protopterus annectens TaxID=7888 RepID=UPI001CFB6FC7|nr:cadherin-related family member 2 [Protopterus annectens]
MAAIKYFHSKLHDTLICCREMVDLFFSRHYFYINTLLENVHSSVRMRSMDSPFSKATEHNVNVYGKEASTSVNITIKIEDINDNKPEFYNCSDNLECRFTQESQQDNFAVEIEEHSSRGVPVITIGAKDSDEGINSRFVLYLEGPNANVFTVSPNVITGSSSFQLFVADSVALDYEKTRTMNVVIVANDTGNSADCCSEANITIRLLDINDHSPEFPHQTYTLEVKEHSADGSLVSNITAFDPDSGCFGNITYDLRPATLLNTLEINKLNGEITVKNSILLDRETRPNYFITLVGTDCGDRVGSTVIELNLIDINDYTPTGRQIYNTFWRENANNPPLDIEAFDNDEPENNNSKVQYHIEPGTYSQNFTIGLDDGNLNHYGNLDREDIHIDLNGQITLNVSACDLGEPRNCFFINVTINVEDTNDNLPVFNQSSYNFTVKESEKGIYVNNVTAKDRDQTVANSRLTFQITNGGMGSFTIRSATDNEREGYHGMISVDREIELNYETTKSYTLTVEALDIDSQSAMATVHIEVIDVNDERPSLIPASPNGASAFENMTSLGVITNVLGTDPDTNHSLIYQALDVQCRKNGYSIKDLCHGWFWLHENGSVFINESESVVDFEQCDEVWITVQVIDVYTEKYTDNGKNNYSDPGVLTIAIEDINDNRPEFISQDDVFA